MDRKLHKLDAPPQLNEAAHFSEQLLKKLRRLKNRGYATDEDLAEARQARDLFWKILNRANWRGWWKNGGDQETDEVSSGG